MTNTPPPNDNLEAIAAEMSREAFAQAWQPVEAAVAAALALGLRPTPPPNLHRVLRLGGQLYQCRYTITRDTEAGNTFAMLSFSRADGGRLRPQEIARFRCAFFQPEDRVREITPQERAEEARAHGADPTTLLNPNACVLYADDPDYTVHVG